ncbi:hypothetical protein [Nocardia brasiliensis]|uniref:hypothetical protein n=1 Tax=Nocardia brasiliensis TaxID=37326 RepID=UPI002456B318|nr:hypothetical protein [Nocardia brasiliensis]
MLPRRASDNVAQCLLILASRGPPPLADTPLISAFVASMRAYRLDPTGGRGFGIRQPVMPQPDLISAG